MKLYIIITNETVNHRGSNDLHLPRVRTNWGKQTFIYQASKDWNNLDNDIKSSESMSFFKAKLKSF